MQDWAAYFVYPQFIQNKFDTDWAPVKDTIIWFFCKDLQLFLKVKINQYDHKLDSFIKLLKKTVDIKAITKLKSSSNVWKIDQYYF